MEPTYNIISVAGAMCMVFVNRLHASWWTKCSEYCFMASRHSVYCLAWVTTVPLWLLLYGKHHRVSSTQLLLLEYCFTMNTVITCCFVVNTVNSVVLFRGEHSDHCTSSQGVYMATQSKFSFSCLSVYCKSADSIIFRILFRYFLHIAHTWWVS